MYKVIVIRLFPTMAQEKLFWQNAGTVRWIWNWGLALQKKLYSENRKFLHIYELLRRFTAIRNNEKFIWLQNISRQTENTALIDLDKAYKHFFRRLREGRTGGMPKFKVKGKSAPSFPVRSNKVRYDCKGRVYLEKIGYVRSKSQHNINSIKLHNARVKFENGKWLLKCAVEIPAENFNIKLSNNAMGIDVGIKSLAVVSFGGKKRVFRNINRSHKIRRLVKQLRHHHRALSRKQKGSINRLKERYRLQKIYGRLKRIRHNYVQQVAAAIVGMRPKSIVLEDLNIHGMMKNKHLAEAVSEQNLYLFRKLIEYRAMKAGIKIIFADRFYPSSKTCSVCGHIKKDLKLSDRIYKCTECGLIIDRDFNAAKNLESLAL